MMQNISLVTVVHPKAMSYFPKFLESVASQSTKGFTITFFYQNISQDEVELFLDKSTLHDYEIVKIDEKLSISKGREKWLTLVSL